MNMLVASKKDYGVNAQWGGRLETAESLATRWLALVSRLQTIHPAFAKWTHWEEDKGFVPFDPRFEAQLARMIASTTRTQDGRLFPHLGTRLWNTTDPCPRTRCFKIQMRAGLGEGSNQIIGGSAYEAIPDPDVFTYRVLRDVMLAEAETFEATQVRVYPKHLRHLWTDTRGIGDDLDLAWISYVAPRFAHLVSPPPSVVVERRPDGGLLMAATDEIFSTDNPAHLAAAREIKAALGPYNAVPWTAETGK